MVRAWAVLILGTVSITVGIIEGRPDLLITGFAVLGAEPVTKAGETVANGGAIGG